MKNYVSAQNRGTDVLEKNSVAPTDLMSVVTNERLQRFNEILGLQSPGAKDAAQNLANLEMDEVAADTQLITTGQDE